MSRITDPETAAIGELAAMHTAVHTAIRTFGSDWTALQAWCRDLRAHVEATTPNPTETSNEASSADS
jgi:hypothetical protein